jgi:hypothetical protein
VLNSGDVEFGGPVKKVAAEGAISWSQLLLRSLTRSHAPELTDERPT